MCLLWFLFASNCCVTLQVPSLRVLCFLICEMGIAMPASKFLVEVRDDVSNTPSACSISIFDYYYCYYLWLEIYSC